MENSIKLTFGPRLYSCSFNLHPDVEEPEEKFSVKTGWGITINIEDDLKEFLLIFSVRSEDDKLPFDFEVHIQAKYEVIKKMKADGIKKAAVYEGTSALYPLLREYVADLTRKSNFPPLYLGTPNYDDIYEALADSELKKNS